MVELETVSFTTGLLLIKVPDQLAWVKKGHLETVENGKLKILEL